MISSIPQMTMFIQCLFSHLIMSTYAITQTHLQPARPRAPLSERSDYVYTGLKSG